MAVVFMDGCDNFNSEALMRDAGYDGTSTFFTGATTGGRFNNGYVNSWNDDASMIRPVITPTFTGLASCVIGFSSWWDSADVISTDGLWLVQWREGTTAHGGIRLRTAGPRTLQVYTVSSYQGSASSYQHPLDQWVNFQVKVVFNDTTGSVVMKADGTEILNVTGIDTINGGTGVCNNVAFGGADSNSSTYHRIDDIAVWSLTGDAPTDFIADYRIDPLRPTGDGTTQWQRSAGAAQYTQVDENPSNSDTDYNFESVTGEYDRLSLPSLPSTSDTIYAVRSVVHAKKSDAGASAVQVGVYSNSTTEGLSGSQNLSTDYAFYDHILTVNPSDSLAWADADIDALQIQYEVG